MNQILSAIQAVKTERADAEALRKRLTLAIDDAVDFVTSQCMQAGLPVSVEACLGGTSRELVTLSSNPTDRAVSVWVCRSGRHPSRAGDKAVCLFTLRWYPASTRDDDYQNPLPEGWCCTDQTTDRCSTAVAAIEAALQRPATVRRVAEALIGLGA